jgi:hypothetical protein
MARLVARIDSIEPFLENIRLLLPRCGLAQLRQKLDGLLTSLGARFLRQSFHFLPGFTLAPRQSIRFLDPFLLCLLRLPVVSPLRVCVRRQSATDPEHHTFFIKADIQHDVYIRFSKLDDIFDCVGLRLREINARLESGTSSGACPSLPGRASRQSTAPTPARVCRENRRTGTYSRLAVPQA